jgi:hypothetical protein
MGKFHGWWWNTQLCTSSTQHPFLSIYTSYYIPCHECRVLGQCWMGDISYLLPSATNCVPHASFIGLGLWMCSSKRVDWVLKTKPITQILAWELFSAQIHFHLRPKDPTCASWSTIALCLVIVLYPCPKEACKMLVMHFILKLDDVRASPTMHHIRGQHHNFITSKFSVKYLSTNRKYHSP